MLTHTNKQQQMMPTFVSTYLALNRPALLVGAREGQKLGGRFDFFPAKDQGLLEVRKGNPKGGSTGPESFDASHGGSSCSRSRRRLGAFFLFHLWWFVCFVAASKGKISGKYQQELALLFVKIGNHTGRSGQLNVVSAAGLLQQRAGSQRRGLGRKHRRLRCHGPIGGKNGDRSGWLFALAADHQSRFAAGGLDLFLGGDLAFGGRRGLLFGGRSRCHGWIRLELIGLLFTEMSRKTRGFCWCLSATPESQGIETKNSNDRVGFGMHCFYVKMVSKSKSRRK